jgi:hypothetical protein
MERSLSGETFRIINVRIKTVTMEYSRTGIGSDRYGLDVRGFMPGTAFLSPICSPRPSKLHPELFGRWEIRRWYNIMKLSAEHVWRVLVNRNGRAVNSEATFPDVVEWTTPLGWKYTCIKIKVVTQIVVLHALSSQGRTGYVPNAISHKTKKLYFARASYLHETVKMERFEPLSYPRM